MNRTILLIITNIIVCIAPVLPLMADDADSLLTMHDYYLNTVTVTGTRTPKTLDNTPVVTRIITAADIKKIDAINIKDVLLSEIPGVEFSYSMNQQVSMRMQGLGGMSVLFLIDGERMAGETLDNIDFSRINTDDIERIEIIKGAASALYGSNSVGAVINIITKTKSEPWALQVNSRIGNRYGEQKHGGMFSLKQGRFVNIFNLQYSTINSYRVYDKPTENSQSEANSTPVYGSHQWNFRDKLIFQLAEGHQLTARAGYYFHERNSSPEQKDRARDFSGGLRYVGKLTNQSTLDIGYNGDRYDKSDYYRSTKKDFLDYKNEQHTLRTAYSNSLTDDFVITVGGDIMSDYLKSYQFSSENDHHTQVTADIFAQSDWTINSHWNVIAGLRTDYFSRHGWELAPKVAAMYKVSNLKFRGSYSKGFRAPTLKEMYMDFNMANIFNIYGNENLKSEQTNSFALSAEYMKKYYCFVVTGFYNILDNEITTIWNPSLNNGRGGMKYQNIDGTNLFGADISLIARYPSGFNGKLCYSYFHEYTRNGQPNTSDSRPHTITAQADYTKSWKNYQMNIVLNGRFLSRATFHTYVTGQYDQFEKTVSAAYTMWKLTMLQKFYDTFTLTVSVDNLFNYKPKTYQYNSPFTLGTTLNIGLSIDVHRLVDLF